MVQFSTQRFSTVKTPDGFRFTFYCDLCDWHVQTPEIKHYSFERAFMQAKKHARQYFNMCHKCDRWVCDEHYNEDEMQCIKCAPNEARRSPVQRISTLLTCKKCGYINANGDCFCQKCGAEL